MPSGSDTKRGAPKKCGTDEPKIFLDEHVCRKALRVSRPGLEKREPNAGVGVVARGYSVCPGCVSHCVQPPVKEEKKHLPEANPKPLREVPSVLVSSPGIKAQTAPLPRGLQKSTGPSDPIKRDRIWLTKDLTSHTFKGLSKHRA